MVKYYTEKIKKQKRILKILKQNLPVDKYKTLIGIANGKIKTNEEKVEEILEYILRISRVLEWFEEGVFNFNKRSVSNKDIQRHFEIIKDYIKKIEREVTNHG